MFLIFSDIAIGFLVQKYTYSNSIELQNTQISLDWNFTVASKLLTGLEDPSGVLSTDDAGQSVFPGDHRPVADEAAKLGDDSSQQREVRRPADVRRMGHQHIASLDLDGLLEA